MSGLRGSYRLGTSEGWSNKDYGLHYGGSTSVVEDDMSIYDNDINDVYDWVEHDGYSNAAECSHCDRLFGSIECNHDGRHRKGDVSSCEYNRMKRRYDNQHHLHDDEGNLTRYGNLKAFTGIVLAGSTLLIIVASML